MGASAAIVTPLARLVLRPRREHSDRNLFVGKAASVRRQCARIGARRGQRLSHPALDVNTPKPEMGMGHSIAVGGEDHSATIASPTAHDIKTRMISQAPGLATGSGDHIHISVAGYSAGEGYKRSIRRKVGIGFDIRGRGQPAGLPAAARYNPQGDGILNGAKIATA